jgi:hypothetical protein
MFAGVIQRGDTFAARIDTALADRQPLPRPDLRQYQQALGFSGQLGGGHMARMGLHHHRAARRQRRGGIAASGGKGQRKVSSI